MHNEKAKLYDKEYCNAVRETVADSLLAIHDELCICIKILHFALLIIVMMFSQSCGSKALREPSVRPMAVAGQFYPADADSLRAMVAESFRGTKSTVEAGAYVQSVIVPHAGYVFSAHAAAWSYAQLPREGQWDRVFLIGPSHHVAFDGASACDAFDCYETPLGLVAVDTDLASRLNRENKCFNYVADAHTAEHCLEVQLPMLQYWLRKPMRIVPIIIGTLNGERLREIAKALQPWYNERNLFVISSDFSHYPPYDDACRIDSMTAEAVASGDVGRIVRTVDENATEGVANLATSACGLCGILVNAMLAEGDSSARCRKLYYCNSGDSRYGSKDEVVGYNAFATIRKKPADFQLSSNDRELLLRIARQSIEGAVRGNKPATIRLADLSPALRERCGAFVTLTEDGRLRGCIGHFGSDQPLFKVVEDMAVAPADVASEQLSPRDLVGLARRYRQNQIAYTYTEPLTWIEYMRDTARLAHEAGMANILVSAGYVCHQPLADLLPYLDAANIDLKSFSDTIYNKVSGASLQPVLDTLQAIRQAGVWLEITHLLIPTINDDPRQTRLMCQWLFDNGFADVPLHITRFFPQYRLAGIPPTPIDTMQNARRIALEVGMRRVKLGNV